MGNGRRALGAMPAALLAAGLFATAAAAQTPRSGWYAGVTLLGAYAQFDEVRTRGFTQPIVEHDEDWVAGVAGRVGYAWRNLPIRAELELTHRYRFDLDVKDSAATLIDYESNVGTTTLLATAILEWRNSSALRPFAGVTLGAAHHFTDTERTDPGTGERRGRDRRQTNFAWGGLIGVDWDFAERWTAEAAYRYLNMGKVTTGTLFTGERIEASPYESHDLLLSLLYRFGP